MIAVANNATQNVLLWVIITDLYTNFLSVMLSFKYYNKWYNGVCGCCHKYCIKLFGYAFSNTRNDKKIQIKLGIPKINNIKSNSATTTPVPQIRTDIVTL